MTLSLSIIRQTINILKEILLASIINSEGIRCPSSNNYLQGEGRMRKVRVK